MSSFLIIPSASVAVVLLFFLNRAFFTSNLPVAVHEEDPAAATPFPGSLLSLKGKGQCSF